MHKYLKHPHSEDFPCLLTEVLYCVIVEFGLIVHCVFAVEAMH